MILDVSEVCSKMNSDLVTFIHNIVVLIKIAVPIVLVIFGMIDLGKGVIASKEDEIKKGQHTFLKRLLAGVIVFFMISIVQLVVSVIDKDSDGDFWSCANGILNGNAKWLENIEKLGDYDDETEKTKKTEERHCKNNQAKDEYDRCLNYQSQRICDTIFQTVCISETEVLWEQVNSPLNYIEKYLENYACEDINSDYKEMYYRALYSCSFGQTSWGNDTCIRYLYPYCKPKASNDNKQEECCFQAGGIIKKGECTGYDDYSQAKSNKGKAIKRNIDEEKYNECMAN